MSDPILELRDLSIHYGRQAVVDHVSLAVRPGSVYALLGRNGAGKSSLVRALLGLQKPTGGAAFILGQSAWERRAEVMAHVGYVPEDAETEKRLTVAALEQFQATLYPDWDEARFLSALGRMEVRREARIGELSKGQRRQVVLAAALATSPQLLVLDDPTLGLDVVAKKELYDQLVAELADRGTTTLITTHDLAGIEGIADRIGILADGKLVLDEELETVKVRFRRLRRREASAPPRLTVLRSQQWGEWVEEVVADYPENADLPAVEASPMSLEEIFLAVAGGKGEQS